MIKSQQGTAKTKSTHRGTDTQILIFAAFQSTYVYIKIIWTFSFQQKRMIQRDLASLSLPKDRPHATLIRQKVSQHSVNLPKQICYTFEEMKEWKHYRSWSLRAPPYSHTRNARKVYRSSCFASNSCPESTCHQPVSPNLLLTTVVQTIHSDFYHPKVLANTPHPKTVC